MTKRRTWLESWNVGVRGIFSEGLIFSPQEGFVIAISVNQLMDDCVTEMYDHDLGAFLMQ